MAAEDTRFDSARELLTLARQFRDRAQAAEADLLAAFTAQAMAFAPDVAPLVIDDDDDERLELRADGRLAGEVLDQETDSWVRIETPQDVALYYDPTDVFLDLADELMQQYPELADDETGEVVPSRTLANGRESAGADDASSAPSGSAPPESATLAMLKDLLRSGALSEADFQRLREQMKV